MSVRKERLRQGGDKGCQIVSVLDLLFGCLHVVAALMQYQGGDSSVIVFQKLDFCRNHRGKELRLRFGVERSFALTCRLRYQLPVLQRDHEIKALLKFKCSDILSENFGIDLNCGTDGGMKIGPSIFSRNAVYYLVTELDRKSVVQRNSS